MFLFIYSSQDTSSSDQERNANINYYWFSESILVPSTRNLQYTSVCMCLFQSLFQSKAN